VNVVVSRLGADAPSSGVIPQPFRFSAPDSLAGVFRQAGFAGVIEYRRDVLIRWPGSAEAFVAWRLATTAGPFQALFKQLLDRAGSSEREDIAIEMAQRIHRYVRDEMVILPAEIVLVVASK
jgi:hypothetical protein